MPVSTDNETVKVAGNRIPLEPGMAKVVTKKHDEPSATGSGIQLATTTAEKDVYENLSRAAPATMPMSPVELSRT